MTDIPSRRPDAAPLRREILRLCKARANELEETYPNSTEERKQKADQNRRLYMRHDRSVSDYNSRLEALVWELVYCELRHREAEEGDPK